MSEIDYREADDAELELNPETLEDLEVAEGGNDPKGGVERLAPTTSRG